MTMLAFATVEVRAATVVSHKTMLFESIVFRRSGHSHWAGGPGLPLHVRLVRFAHAYPKMLCVTLVYNMIPDFLLQSHTHIQWNV